jgi:hypothetical protein
MTAEIATAPPDVDVAQPFEEHADTGRAVDGR